MLKRIITGFLLFLNLSAFSMALKEEKIEPVPTKFLEQYSVGLLMFDNNSGNTNLDFLSISFPLMLKDYLKRNVNFFIERADLLTEKEKFSDKKDNYSNKKNDRYYLLIGSLDLDKNNKVIKKNIKLTEDYKKASLKKQLFYKSDVVVRNEQTLHEVAVKQNCHYLIYGNYKKVGNGKLKFSVYFYNAIQNKNSYRWVYTFDENRVLIELPSFVKKIKKDLINFPFTKFLIDTEPQGAMIYFDGQFIGRTPLSVDAAFSEHIILLKKDGYKRKRLLVNLKRGNKYRIVPKLEKQQKEGVLTVTSIPPGAELTVDLIKYGKTPCVISNMQAGTYRLLLDMDKYYQKIVRVEISGNKETKISLKMQEKIKGYLSPAQRGEKMRKWMNTFFWSTGGSILVYGITYFKYKDYLFEYERYVYSGNTTAATGALKSANNYHKVANGLLGFTAGCLATSTYFLVRYLLIDDKELGGITKDRDVFFAPTHNGFQFGITF